MGCGPWVLAAALLSAGMGVAQAQGRMIAGRVTDQVTGKPVPTGEVWIPGTNSRDRLRPDGVFVLRVPERKVTVSVRSAGYKTVKIEVPVGVEAVPVVLEPDVHELAEVVVSGQATVPRRTGAASVATVRAEAFRDVPAANLAQALQGKVPGADVRLNSGVPGGALQLRLRGINTILGNVTPLYVVDGVVLSDASIPSGSSFITRGQEELPSRIADLNVNDIETVEILRGAAAAVLYGSRGANGVVIIKTKRGQPRQEP